MLTQALCKRFYTTNYLWVITIILPFLTPLSIPSLLSFSSLCLSVPSPALEWVSGCHPRDNFFQYLVIYSVN